MINIPDSYFSGFVDGEGCFYVGIVPSKFNKNGFQIITEFHVSQNPRGRIVLDQLKNRLGCGYIKPNHKASTDDVSLVLVVKDNKDLKEKVIPFFLKNPLISGKYQDFLKFKETVELISQGEHLTDQGFKLILDLAYSMNTTHRRIPKGVILSRLKSSQAIR
ncbi:hypothetical protein A2716_01770 [candidate division WWE3 bacterium RIFCSPHIGHO2_01_FULL_40_23]|uniref:Homing endonuclease LAGLIDADG domain-containing protein n=1 Tax=candidate division WWE3 bacterium RIFCSPLOWO2_01_FULL_41_18 TaxID=1802625 RepID=A0A1F4VFJ7_UNCKA|nr:MAG: hypothetical protein A2716_01770 [candidate division WWE3 bacterium RIFCSPHIGHO2_01_FULL_40_23]OGC55720.1 MAG: hypothetical protein A3A78_01620 [candidate division WWE3 bacterium RIFCSPLOWO2_01_FULL_41_18]